MIFSQTFLFAAAGLAWAFAAAAAEMPPPRPKGPALLSWEFETPGPRLAEDTGTGIQAVARGCGRAPGHPGMALALNGDCGMVIPPTAGMHADRGLTLECWIRLRSAAATTKPVNIVSKPGEFMLRIDPGRAGGNLSFYLRDAKGGWEPRIRGGIPATGKWLHLLAVWDRKRLYLWVDRILHTVDRASRCVPNDSPVYVGGPVPELGLDGCVGRIDGLRLRPRALSFRQLSRRVYGLEGNPAGPPRTNGDFVFDSGSEGWTGDVPVTVEHGVLRAGMKPGFTMLRRLGLRLDTAACPIASLRLAVSGPAERGVLTFAGDRICKDVPFRVIADGRMRWYTLRCADQAPWRGKIDALGFRLEGDGKAPVTLRLDALHVGSAVYAPPDLRLVALAPERRICSLETPVKVLAWIRNFGKATSAGRLHLAVPAGAVILDRAERRLPRLGFDELRAVTWQILAARPLEGEIRVTLNGPQGPGCAMERPVAFAANPEAAARRMAREQVWRRAGYPRPMDFRHLWPQSIPFLEHDSALLVDLAGDKIAAAIEYKQRYPDRLVLMQVNDERNGLWGSWHCVPREFAAKAGLRCDPAIFPMPEFRGYWLLGPRALLARDFPVDAESVDLPVPEPGLFFAQARSGRRELRDVLIYALDEQGKPRWEYSEYASVTTVDLKSGTITLRRWPRAAVGPWRAFRKKQAAVAPSVGDIYRMHGKVLKTWVPNLTRFCPRDPRTGWNACEWWARHFARLWHRRIASSEPHPDGFEFDGLRAGRISDCNRDGIVDAGAIGGVDYWLLGLDDFFRALRAGGADWQGLGEALILADSGLWGPRDFRLLNGSESEEFPSFSGMRDFPQGMDLYRLWCNRAARPVCAYIQERYGCDTYLERDWSRLLAAGKFHPDSAVRLSIAAACMGTGFTTYRTGSRRDAAAIAAFEEWTEYPWDEYCAGREGRFNWLGLPLEPARRITHTLGPDLLPAGREGIAGWQVVGPAARAGRVTLRERLLDGDQWFEIAVPPPPASSQGPWGGSKTGKRLMLLTPQSAGRLAPNAEYCLEIRLAANSVLPKQPGKDLSGRARPVGFALQADDGRLGQMQWILAAPAARAAAITLRAPAGGGPCRVAVLAGWGVGPLRLTRPRLRKGCAEIFFRRFEHGLVLANGSATTPVEFDLRRIDRGRRHRRLPGFQAPDWNDGAPVAGRIQIPPADGLLLMTP